VTLFLPDGTPVLSDVPEYEVGEDITLESMAALTLAMFAAFAQQYGPAFVESVEAMAESIHDSLKGQGGVDA
jgi:hypothetical protein